MRAAIRECSTDSPRAAFLMLLASSLGRVSFRYRFASSSWNGSSNKICRCGRRNTKNLAFRIRLTICSSCIENSTGGCQRNGGICSPLASRLFQTYCCQDQREKRVHFSHRSNLPLMPFLSQSPDTLVSIDADHPDGQS